MDNLSTDEVSSRDHPWPQQVDAALDRLREQLVEVRRYLHSHPEPSGAEVGTSRYLHEVLTAHDIPARLGRDGLGVIADLNVGQPSEEAPIIGIRADIDALHLVDGKSTAYASQNPGVCHACGHDAHATIALAAGLAAQAWGSAPLTPTPTGMRLRLIFQPAEETSQGARWMIEQDAMVGVGYMLGLHVDPERPYGQIGIRHGTLTANCDELEVHIEGRGGHSARPHHAHDPLAAAADLIQACYAQLPRTVDSRLPAVLTFGRIYGGSANNVIPQKVELGGTLRTTDQAVRETLKETFQRICTSIEQAHRVSVSGRFFNQLGAVNNHPFVTEVLEQACLDVLPAEQVKHIEFPSMGGEDFSEYLQFAPGSMMRVGCAAPGSQTHLLHHPLFDIDERILVLGPRILLRAAANLAARVAS